MVRRLFATVGSVLAASTAALVLTLAPSAPAQAQTKKPARPPYEGCVAVTKQEYDSARRQNLLRTRFSQYLRTGLIGRRHYWYCR